MSNQPRPHAIAGTPQPMTPAGAVEEQHAPTTLLEAQAAERARHQEAVERMKAAAGVTDPRGSRDPLSRPYRLASGGLWYPPGHGGMIYIAPTRGEQEEVIAGMGEGAAASATLRHVAEQVVDFNDISINDLLVLDWPGLILHLLAYSAGDDRVFLAPLCPKPRGCGKPSNQTRSLTEMDCAELRVGAPGQASSWPVPEPADDDIAILEEITGGDKGMVSLSVGPSEVAEPFYTEPLQTRDGRTYPGTGDRIGWRHLRMKDLQVAEEFSSRTGSEAIHAGSKLNNVVLALQIVSINGTAGGLTGAYSWIKRTASPILIDLRRQLERRSFGYNMRPRFRCPHCGHSFKAALPLDGSLFRGGRS